MCLFWVIVVVCLCVSGLVGLCVCLGLSVYVSIGLRVSEFVSCFCVCHTSK